MSKKARTKGGVPKLLDGLLSFRARMSARTVSDIASFWNAGLTDRPPCSPKPNLPSAQDYEKQASAANREVGPPPPGYGRYDYAGGVQSASTLQGPPRRNLDEVMCFKVRLTGNQISYP